MPRNLVMCFDGTGAQVRATRNSNVVELYQMLQHDQPHVQLSYYEPGVGTRAASGALTPLTRWLTKMWGLAFGSGLKQNVADAYVWLAHHWSPGDRIYLFGFSRGAYTARALAGMLESVGLVRTGSANMAPYLMASYSRQAYSRAQAIRDRRARTRGAAPATPSPAAPLPGEASAVFDSDPEALQQIFARSIRPPDAPPEIAAPPIAYIGLWDTVDSVGLFTWPLHLRYTERLPAAERVRQALSIHEWRRPFLYEPIDLPADGSREQVWFSGVHSDVGGGFADQDLARIPLKWVTDGAIGAGLLIDPAAYARFCTLDGSWATSPVHRLTPWWRLLGTAHRQIRPGSSVHESVRARMASLSDVTSLPEDVDWVDAAWLVPCPALGVAPAAE